MRNGYSFSKESIPVSKTHCPMVFTSVFSLTSSFHLFSRILDTVASVPSLPLGYLLFSLIRFLLFFSSSMGAFPGLFSDSPSLHVLDFARLFSGLLFNCNSLMCYFQFLVDRTSFSFILSM